MGDPFEQPTGPPGTATQASAGGVRETSVQQAVVFLSDPRVRGADLSKAAAFLRSKGVTEDEIRQAFTRSGLIYPPPHSNGTLVTSNFPANSVYFPNSGAHGRPHPQPPPRSSSWWPLVLGVAAAAAVYSAGREILRQYVVPLYFPDTGQGMRGGSSGGEIPSSARRGPQHSGGRTARGDEDEIAKLTERVNALTELSKRTTDSVERLAQTVDAAHEKNDRSAVAITELRDAIRHLSQSISASREAKNDGFGNEPSGIGVTGQSSSVAVIDTSSILADDDRESNGFKGSERSSLQRPYGTTNNRKMGILAYGTSGASSMAGTNESTYASGRTERPSIDRAEMENDDFLNLAPAEIQDNWRYAGREARSSDERESLTSAMSGDGVRDVKAGAGGKEVFAKKPEEGIVDSMENGDEQDERSLTSANASASGAIVAHATADADLSTDCGVVAETGADDSVENENNGSTCNEADASHDFGTPSDRKLGRYKETFDENGSRDYDRTAYGMGDSGGRGIAAARMLFEADILAETRGLFGQTSSVTGSGVKNSNDRPVSMPAMDAPLSDVE